MSDDRATLSDPTPPDDQAPPPDHPTPAEELDAGPRAAQPAGAASEAPTDLPLVGVGDLDQVQSAVGVPEAPTEVAPPAGPDTQPTTASAESPSEAQPSTDGPPRAPDAAAPVLPAEGSPATPADGSVAAAEGASATTDSGALEELTLPPSVQAPEPLAAGAAIGPDGRLRIVQHLAARGRVNRYAATWQNETDQPVEVELREGPADHAALAREAEILAGVQYAMLPRRYAAFEHEGRRYLAIERIEGQTLEQALREGRPVDEVISIVVQLAQVLRRLHAAGWALVGLAPADVCLGQPVRLTQLGSAVRIGQEPPHALHVAGYSAPELAHRTAVTGKEDVYTLGAILYRAISGHPLSEAGAELSALVSAVPIPGGPQLLGPALAPVDERVELEGFYRQLLDLKQRLTRAPIALEVASGTTVGLNPTRPVNEDSCGYVTWSVSGAEGVSYRALLCVADGMGGMDAGEVASGTALRTIMAAAVAGGPLGSGEPPAGDGASRPPEGSAVHSTPRIDPIGLIEQAAPAVHAAGQGRQMGTTVTCVAVQDGELTLGHVGDTRAYLLRDGALTQLTADHSLVAAMVASGVLTKEEARGHPDSNKVLRSLGSQRELPDGYVDGLSQAYGEPSLQLRPGDWIVLCTDGVWGSVDDERLRATVVEAPDCPTVARLAIERALRAGAPDNAAIVVARCVQMPAS